MATSCGKVGVQHPVVDVTYRDDAIASGAETGISIGFLVSWSAAAPDDTTAHHAL
ncbi:hypothetical protein [Micromonospora marina]|uniref:hypothetical protein n=1 Tax=Micromonospora marina TaxID=307120 RepID=UPI003D73A2AD